MASLYQKHNFPQKNLLAVGAMAVTGKGKNASSSGLALSERADPRPALFDLRRRTKNAGV
jgi:hypothetical protein